MNTKTIEISAYINKTSGKLEGVDITLDAATKEEAVALLAKLPKGWNMRATGIHFLTKEASECFRRGEISPVGVSSTFYAGRIFTKVYFAATANNAKNEGGASRLLKIIAGIEAKLGLPLEVATPYVNSITTRDEIVAKLKEVVA